MFNLNNRIRLNDLFEKEIIQHLSENFDLDKLYITGGNIRNIFLNKNLNNDIDFVYLDSKFLFLKNYFDNIYINYLSTKKLFKSYIFSINSLRKDILDINRNKILISSKSSWLDDTVRRDFICNTGYIQMSTGIFWHPMREKFENDIKHKQLTLINPLRIKYDSSIFPRLIRFIMQYDLSINEKDIIKYKKLKNISSPRTIMEAKKIFEKFSFENCILKLNNYPTIMKILNDLKRYC